MGDDRLIEIVQQLQALVGELAAYVEAEPVDMEETSIDPDRILPNLDELDTLDNEEVDELLTSFAIEGGEVVGTARTKRQALKMIIAELEGDDLEAKWTTSVVKTAAKLLGVAEKEAEVLLAINERANTIFNESPVGVEEEAAESAAEEVKYSVGDAILVSLSDEEVYEGTILDLAPEGRESMVQVSFMDDEGERDVVDVPVDSISPLEVEKAADSAAEEVDLSILFSKEKLEEVADKVTMLSEAEIADHLEDYAEVLRSSINVGKEVEAEEENIEWMETMLAFIENENEELVDKGVFYCAAFLSDGEEDFIEEEDTPSIIDGKLFCNGIPMGLLEGDDELQVIEDGTALSSGDIISNTEEFIPCFCFASARAWVFDITNEEFVALSLGA